MEPLITDGSTLPALKDILPEHFYEQSEQAMRPSQSDANLPHLPNGGPQPQYLQQQQNSGTQQSIQLAFENVIPNGEYGTHYPPANSHGRGGRRAKKRSYEDDDVHVSQPQPQDPYFMGPSGPIYEPSTSQDVHLHLPGGTLTHEGIHDDDGEGDDNVGGLDDSENRRHTCSRCGKHFNRPSSLKIHLNTHTGAKPYACPFQGCGRTFNVSSNMRRHFRNHARRPVPPPLPPNGIYPGPVSDQQQEVSRSKKRPSQLGSDAQHQHQPQPLPYDGSAGFRETPEYMKQFYPPSSDMRNSRSGQDNKPSRRGALMTPPYTNEGEEYDQDNQNERSTYSQIPPYYAFGAGPGPNAAFGNPHMGVGMPGLHASLGFPGMGGGPPQMFPVDPSLASGRHEGGVDAAGEADADGELDPDIEHDPDAQGDRGNSEMRRIGPSTSNTRASSNPKADILRGEAVRTNSADGIANIPVSVPFANANGIPTPAGSGPGSVHFQASLPMPTSAVNDSAQAALYAQQYQAHYAQQQQYEHQPQQMFQGGVNVMYGNGPAFGIPTFPLQIPPGQISYHNVPYASLPTMQQQMVLSLRGNGRPVNNPIGMYRDRDEIGQQRSSELRLHAENNIRTAYDMQRSNPGAVPAPPYKLYSHPPPEISGGKSGADKAVDPSQSDGADTLEDTDSSGDFEEGDDDDDDYTGKPISKRGRGAKRGATRGRTRGRPRGRPRGSGKGSGAARGSEVARGSGAARGGGRGRGRPRKSAATVDPNDTKEDKKPVADSSSQQMEESDCRITRSRLRTRSSEKA